MADAVVVAETFRAERSMKFTMRKIRSDSCAIFDVVDGNDNIIFKVRQGSGVVHHRRVLCDSTDRVILTMKKKILTRRRRWEVYRGESSSSRDIIFSARSADQVQLTNNLLVFLPNNEGNLNPDFNLSCNSGIWIWGSYYNIYNVKNVIIGKVSKKFVPIQLSIQKDIRIIKVPAGVDYAFIVTLLVIFYEIRHTPTLLRGAVTPIDTTKTWIAEMVYKIVAMGVAVFSAVVILGIFIQMMMISMKL